MTNSLVVEMSVPLDNSPIQGFTHLEGHDYSTHLKKEHSFTEYGSLDVMNGCCYE